MDEKELLMTLAAQSGNIITTKAAEAAGAAQCGTLGPYKAVLNVL